MSQSPAHTCPAVCGGCCERHQLWESRGGSCQKVYESPRMCSYLAIMLNQLNYAESAKRGPRTGILNLFLLLCGTITLKTGNEQAISEFH